MTHRPRTTNVLGKNLLAWATTIACAACSGPNAEQTPVPTGDVCDLLDSSAALEMSGAGSTALMHLCGRLPTDKVGSATGALPTDGVFKVFAGPDVQVNATPDTGASTTQSETSVAVTGGTLVAGWNDSSDYAGRNSFTGYGVSTDGGATWTDRGALLPDGVVIGGVFGDPWLRAHDATGNFYFASLANTPGGQSALAVFAGATVGVAPDWPAVTNVTPGQPGFQDKEAFDVDNSGGPLDGRVYLCWRQFLGTNNIKLSINDTAGADLALTHVGVQDMNAVGATGQGCFVEVDQNTGDVWVAWETFVPRGIAARRSTDGGATFGPVVAIATFAAMGHTSTCAQCPGRQVLDGNIRVFEFISSMTVSPVSGNLHAVFAADGAGADESDVFHVRCVPGAGNTVGACTAPFRLNSDVTANDQWHPYVDSAPNGDLAVFWYDRRLDNNNSLIDVYRRFSSDDGATWTADERVTDVSFGVPALCPNFDPTVAACYMGEYNHIASDANNQFYYVWGDNRNLVGTRPDPDVFFESGVNEPPVLSCAGLVVNNDPNQCGATIACPSVASCVDPEGRPVTLSCSVSVYPVGTTSVTVTCSDGTHTTSDSCAVTVNDAEAPAIMCPADVTLECPADTSVPANGSASATDNCAVATIEHADTSVGGCGDTEAITRAWTATDSASNSAACVQSLAVVDTTPPTVMCSATPVGDDDDRDSDHDSDRDSDSDSDRDSDQKSGRHHALRLDFSSSDSCGSVTTQAFIEIDGGACGPVPVSAGQIVDVKCGRDHCKVDAHHGKIKIKAGVARLVVTAVDECGNTSVCTEDLCTAHRDAQPKTGRSGCSLLPQVTTRNASPYGLVLAFGLVLWCARRKRRALAE